MTSLRRLNDIKSFYSILEELENRIHGKATLSTCTGYSLLPQRGVYFFFEKGQERIESGDGLRVTRVGTHALKQGSKSTLWNRLSQHKGSVKSGGGNHRGSIFRLIVGTAIISNQNLNYPNWGVGNSSTKEIRESEIPLERKVSDVIRKMPFVYLSIPDEASPKSIRGYIERNSISLLSNFEKSPIDLASENWLGHYCNREKVRKSGLWNQNHVDENYDPEFIPVFNELVQNIRG